MAITDWPEDERPRERLLAQGAAALSDAELLALFLRVRWKRARAADLARMLCGPFAASLAAGLLAAGWAGAWTAWKPWVALSLILAAWIALTALLHVVQRVRATRTAPWAQPAAFLGMHLAHLGIAVFVVGVALVNGYQVERDVRLAPGERVALAGYEFRFQGVRQAHGANYQALVGAVDLIRDGRVLRQLAPEKRIYPSSGMPMTEAAIDSGFLRDVYVSLGEPVEREHVDGDWVLRLHYKPFVGWIWGGCALMALGGLLAMSDRRYRIGRPGQSNVGAPPRRARETVR